MADQITGDYAEHNKDDLRKEIDRRGLEQPSSRADKDTLIDVLSQHDATRSTNDGSDAGDDETKPPAGDGAGTTAQPVGDDEDGDDAELSPEAGQPATAEATQLLLNEQHGASPEVVEQSEAIQDDLESRQEDARSNVQTLSDADAKALFDHNTAVPLWRRNTEDLTEEQKKAPSDYPTPTGDGAAPYSEEHQDAADAEREQKNSTLPKFDTREQYDERVPIDSQKPERLGESGRGGMPRSDDDEVKPWVGGGEKQKYVAPNDTTFREIATLLGLNRPEELAFINGRYDGTQHVAKGTEVLLPEGYDFR